MSLINTEKNRTYRFINKQWIVNVLSAVGLLFGNVLNYSKYLLQFSFNYNSLCHGGCREICCLGKLHGRMKSLRYTKIESK